MIYDLLEKFNREYELKGDKIILDTYQLKEGLYVKYKRDLNLEYFIVRKNKDKQSEMFDINNELVSNETAMWFKTRDYYSYWLDANKSIDSAKKVHSINYLSFFVKIKSFSTEVEKEKITKEIIKKYFNTFLSFKSFKKREEKDVLKSFNSTLRNCKRKKEIVKYYKNVSNNIDLIYEKSKELEVDNYIKVYKEEDVSLYEAESEIYYALKIFNKIDYSVKIEEKIYGMPNSNISLNDKKPFLGNKSRKLDYPFLATVDDTIKIKKFFDWLSNQKNEDLSIKTLDEKFYIKTDFKEKDLIIDYDNIPKIGDALRKNPIIFYDFIKKEISKKGDETKDDKFLKTHEINDIRVLENMVNDYFYFKQLIHHYYGKIKVNNYCSGKMQKFLYISRDAMFTYFHKKSDKEFYQIIHKYGSEYVLNNITQDRWITAVNALNLLLSLKKYYKIKNKTKDDTMDVLRVKNSVFKKIENGSTEQLDKEEFYFLCGQVTKYLITQSKSKNTTMSLAEGILRAKTLQTLKNNIMELQEKFLHVKSLNSKRYQSAMVLVLSYEGEEKIKQNIDSLLIGYMSENIFYMKSEETEKEEK